MARKPMYDGGTQNKIIEVASRMFFEKGFDGTSIRGIMSEVGGEIGLFYYYFKTKDALFTEVLERFFEPYRSRFAALVDEARHKPQQALFRFFMYIKQEVCLFRERYADHMHRTVRWAIREQTLTVIEPYIEEIIRILITFGAKPRMEARVTAVFLAHGVGSVLLHEDAAWVEETTNEIRRTVNMIMGLDAEASRRMFEM